MTESEGASNSWRSKQSWIKDVLSKSGTELMAITTKPATATATATTATATATATASTTTSNSVRNGAARKLVKKGGVGGGGVGGAGAGDECGKDLHHKMVYYQSTPLMIKTEQPSQAQFCTPLRTAATATTSAAASASHHQQPQQLQQNLAHAGNGRNGAAAAMQQQQLSQSSINTNAQIPQNLLTAPNQSFLTTIKAEALPPSITIYATSSPTTALGTAPSIAAGRGVSSNSTAPLTAAAVATAAGRKTAAGKPQFKCEQCGMTFGSKSAHTSHTKSHAKNGDFGGGSGVAGNSANAAVGSATAAAAAAAGLADINEAGFALGIPKTPNVSGVASGDPYQCNVCQKTFAVPARLIRHYRTHTGERPFECEFCHKLFSVKENLQVHRRIHTKERPYKCDVCGRAFEHSGKLHRHMRIHTGERPHKCSVCEKTFIQSGQLVIHMRTHTGEKPYKCPVEGCGKGFTCSKQLKVHSRTHTGEKPYHCDICFRDFGYNHVLKLHRVQHYGSKCYKCTICDETFKSKKEMEAHIKGHANELPDDEEEASPATNNGGGQVSCSSSGSSGETTSAPGSPHSPNASAAVGAKPKKPKQERPRTATAGALSSLVLLGPPSPSSPRSTLSPASSLASGSRLSAGSPASSIASPSMPATLETDYHSRDSGVASTSNNRQLSAVTTFNANGHQQRVYIMEELPTDLSVQQEQQQLPKYYQHSQPSDTSIYHHQQQQQELQPQSPYAYMHQPPAPAAPLLPQQHAMAEAPTINPALLEAASIASRRAMLDSPREEDVTQAALQIMQLNRAQQRQQQRQSQAHAAQPSHTQPVQHAATLEAASRSSPQRMLLGNDLTQYDDTREANELIEHYRRGELARHGIHKGYAPVPKFEPSLLNNEIIVRQVEAAIAPLRSSTESPERSSSPESDSMMMADRDVMTLPLRKRKLYMHEGSPSEAAASVPAAGIPATAVAADKTGSVAGASAGNGDAPASSSTASVEMGAKVMRMSSVIQFAKAS